MNPVSNYCSYSFLILLSFNFYTRIKSDLYTTIIVLEYSKFDYILTFTVTFTLYVFMLVGMKVFFQFEKLSSISGLMLINSHRFCLSGSLYPSTSERQSCKVEYSWLAVFFLSPLSIYHSALSKSVRYLLRNSLLVL